jgi:hypothetical protein
MDLNPICDHLERLPSVLYKYKSLQNLDQCIALARNGSAFFADARSFNDPFECGFVPKSPMLTLEGSDLVIYLKRRIRILEPTATCKEAEELLAIALGNAKAMRTGDANAMKDVMETQYGAMGILSLTDNPKSLPMWAYYGDSHRGICVGIEVKSIAQHQLEVLKRNDILSIFKVEYDDFMPIVNMESSSDNFNSDELRQAEKPYYTKSKDWEHEQEFRLLFWNHVSSVFSFGSDAIAEVIFGARAHEKDVETVVTELKKAGSTAKLYRSHTAFSSYKLEVHKI